MIIYATYTPNKETGLNRERVFAFASIERFVLGMRQVNEGGKRKGTLRPVTKDEALAVSPFAALFVASDKSAAFDGGRLVDIQCDGVRDDWNGRWKEIELVERMADEKVPAEVACYA